MYIITKDLEISAAHQLKLNYESKCQNLHGHNWKVKVWLRSEKLDENGMVMDFTHIKKKVVDTLDHKNLNEIVDFNPTAENLAAYICELLGPTCFRVQIWEQAGSLVIYEKEN